MSNDNLSNPGRSSRWMEPGGGMSGDAYQSRFDQLASSGVDVHGEASFVARRRPVTVVDAGCGTGRVASELARRGCSVVGVDLDPGILATARGRHPDIEWQLGDLATVDLGRRFGVIVMAGNVMIFVAPGTEPAVVANLARHLEPGGLLIAGFQLIPGRLTIADYDAMAVEAGLALVERFATWDEAPWGPGDDYAVSVHRRPEV